jgi:Glycosyl transferase 4-like domain
MDGKDLVKPLRLLAVIEASTITGPAKNLLQFAALAREGNLEGPPVEVELVVFRRAGDSDVLRQAAEKASIPVHFLAETGRFDRRVIPELKALVQRLHPDIIQTHAVKSHLLIRMAGLHKERPWIAFHHGYTWQNLKVRLYNQLDRWSLPGATAVLTHSRDSQCHRSAMGSCGAKDRVGVRVADSMGNSGRKKGHSDCGTAVP